MPLGLAGSFHAGSVPFREGFVLVGGSSECGRRYHDTLHYYEPEDERWEQMPARLDHARGFHVASECPDTGLLSGLFVSAVRAKLRAFNSSSSKEVHGNLPVIVATLLKCEAHSSHLLCHES